MRKLLNGICLSLALILVIGITTACSMKDNETNVTDEVEELETTLADDLDAMETEALEDVDKATTVSKDKIQESVEYIHEHIDDPVENEEVAKKMYYHSSYIIAVADKKGDSESINDDIYTLAVNTKDYVRSIYTKESTTDDDGMLSLRSDLDDLKDKINEGKDDLIEGFYSLVK